MLDSQLSVKISTISQLSARISAISQLSVNYAWSQLAFTSHVIIAFFISESHAGLPRDLHSKYVFKTVIVSLFPCANGQT